MVKSLSRLELEAIVRDIPSAVLVISKNGTIIFANNNATALFGLNLRGLTVPYETENLLKCFSYTGAQYSYDKLPVRQALAKGIETQDEFIVEKPDGSRAIVRGIASPIKDEQGNLVAAVGIFEDITQRKIFEEALNDERQTLKGIIDSTEAMIAYLDVCFNFLIVNNAYAKASGYSVDQLLGKNHFELFPNPQNQAIFEKVRDTLEPVAFADKPFTFVSQPDRGLTYWDWTLTPVKDANDKLLGLVLVLFETTERKKAEIALRESEERFRLVAEAAKVMVYELEVGEDTVRVFSGEEVLGYSKGEIPASNAWWFSQIHQDDCQRIAQQTADAITTGRDALLEYRVKRKQGDYIIVHDTVKIIKDKDKVVRQIGGLRDITERKENEQALLRSKELLEQKAAEVEEYACSMESLATERLRRLKEAERLAAIGATAGMVGHDIRNPLQAIIADVYLLKQSLLAIPECKTKDEFDESLEGIEKNVVYINKIVQDLQDYARQLTPDCSLVNLTEVVRQTLKAIEIPSNIVVVNNTGYIELKTDGQFLRRALTNLLTNAVQAMPNGGNLTIDAYEKDKKVVLTVQDSGVGIPESVKPKLFTPMVTTKSKGQGLGLAVVKRLVEALGGTITFESEEGKGAKFTIELPQT